MRATRSSRTGTHPKVLSAVLAVLVMIAGVASGPVSPVRAIDPSRVVVAVSAGPDWSVALRADGTAFGAGEIMIDSGFEEHRSITDVVSSWSDVVAVGAGLFHVVGLKSDGTVVAAGNNGDGQCDVAGWTDIVAIAAGWKHTVGVRADGTTVAVGFNGWDQCEVGIFGDDITAVAAGDSHTVGLNRDGTVVTVGDNNAGQCEVSDWKDITAVSAYGWQTIGLRGDGTVVAVGNNQDGQLDVGGWTDIVAIDTGRYHTLGLKSDGTVVVAGGGGWIDFDVSRWNGMVAVSAGGRAVYGLRHDGAIAAEGIGSEVWGMRRVYAPGTWTNTIVSGEWGLGSSHGRAHALSADGRYVAFASGADIVPDDTNGEDDVFVHDRQTGQTTRVSVSSAGAQANGPSHSVSISADGRYVAFTSDASNLVPRDTNQSPDVFVHDRVSRETVRVNLGWEGQELTEEYSHVYASISADGKYVAYSTTANAVMHPYQPGIKREIYVRDWQERRTYWVSRPATGEDWNDKDCGAFEISGNGRYVVFESSARDLVPGLVHTGLGLFVRDIDARSVSRIAVYQGDAEEDLFSFEPCISADGRYVAFVSTDPSLPAHAREALQVFVHDRVTGQTTWASGPTGGEALYYPWRDGTGSSPSISADGRYVAFHSSADNLVPCAVGTAVYIYDRVAGVTRCASVGEDGELAQGFNPSLSADGSAVTFDSGWRQILVPGGETIDPEDPGGGSGFSIFVHEWGIDPPGTTVAGTSRYDTAVAASKAAYPDGLDEAGARTVVIATGRNWPDALGGTALAGALDGPILLTETNTVPDAVMAEVSRLKATKAIVLGGPDVVGPAVISALSSKLGAPNVERIAGTSRYETANAVAARVKSVLGAAYDGTAFVATGGKFPDALAAAPLAAAKGWPLYLAHPSSGLSAATKSAMSGTTRALILGGTDVVSPATESSMKASLGASNVTRLAGTSRYDTAVKVAEYGVASAGLAWDKVGITTGQKFPDALAGGVLQGKAGSVMLLTRTDSLEAATHTALTANKAAIEEVTIYGSTGAVSRGARTAVAQALE